MAYREFRNEKTYAAPDVPNPDLTMAAIAGIGRRKDRVSKEKRDKLDRASRFEIDIEEGKFTDDQELLIQGGREVKIQGQQDYLTQDRLSPQTHAKVSELQGLAKKSKINWDTYQTLLSDSAKVAQDDKYVNLEARTSKIRDAVYGEGVNSFNRGERLKSLKLGTIDEFKAEAQRQDWITAQEVEAYEKNKANETQSGVHTTNNYSIEGRFLKRDPKTGLMVAGVDDADVRNYLGSDPRVGQLYDERINKELAADWEKMKTNKQDAIVRSILRDQNNGEEPTDQQAIDFLKIENKYNAIAPNVDFGTRKGLAIKADLEKAVKVKLKMDTKTTIEQREPKGVDKDGSGKEVKKPIMSFTNNGQMITTRDIDRAGQAKPSSVYVPGKISFTDKNGVQPIKIQASVPYFNFTTKKYHGAESNQALQNIAFSVADANFVVRYADKPGKFVAAKTKDELLSYIKRSKNPENLIPDWYVKGSATDLADDKPVDDFDVEEDKTPKKEDKTIGVFYSDIKDKFAAQNAEINDDDPNFKDKSGDIKEIKAAIEARKTELKKGGSKTVKTVGKIDIGI